MNQTGVRFAYRVIGCDRVNEEEEIQRYIH